MESKFPQSDRDLLVRIDERVRGLADDMREHRAEANERERERDAEMKDVRSQLDSLRLSRAKVYGGAAALSVVSSLAQRLLWK